MLSGTLSKLFSSKHLNNVSVANSQISVTVMGFVIINDKSVFSESFTNIRGLQNTEKTVHILHVYVPPWHFYRMCESCQANDHWSRLHVSICKHETAGKQSSYLMPKHDLSFHWPSVFCLKPNQSINTVWPVETTENRTQRNLKHQQTVGSECVSRWPYEV